MMPTLFDHQALHLANDKRVVFTALSKRRFYMRLLITKFVLDNDVVPINPFTAFDYFMVDTVERDKVRTANNTLVHRSDELWVFGEISDGVLAEILQVTKEGKPIRYFAIDGDKDIREIDKTEVQFEVGVENNQLP